MGKFGRESLVGLARDLITVVDFRPQFQATFILQLYSNCSSLSTSMLAGLGGLSDVVIQTLISQVSESLVILLNVPFQREFWKVPKWITQVPQILFPATLWESSPLSPCGSGLIIHTSMGTPLFTLDTEMQSLLTAAQTVFEWDPCCGPLTKV